MPLLLQIASDKEFVIIYFIILIAEAILYK